MNRLDKLITNNTGYSSKNAVLIVSVFLVAVSVLSFIALLFIDIFHVHLSISTDMFGLAAVIAAIEALIVSLYYFKVKSERNEKNNSSL